MKDRLPHFLASPGYWREEFSFQGFTGRFVVVERGIRDFGSGCVIRDSSRPYNEDSSGPTLPTTACFVVGRLGKCSGFDRTKELGLLATLLEPRSGLKMGRFS